jgi:hypothetical protein
MAKTRVKAEPIGIWRSDDLRPMIAEVRTPHGPLQIRLEDGAKVAIRPVHRRPKRAKSAEREQADGEAFRSAAGARKGLVDA